jgi:4-hydroxybenzoate polyprenyltransferase
MIEVITKVVEFIRWRDWGPSKIPFLCSVLFYIGVATRQFSPVFIIEFVLFTVFAIANAALGYVLNDWGDRELDALHGKRNAFKNLTYSQGLMALTVLVIIAFLSGLTFVLRPRVPLLWGLWAFFTCAYSLKPFRLKERGAWGLSVSALAQWSLPTFLAFAALNHFGQYDMLMFVLAATTNGAALEIAHQRFDRTRDLSTHTGTLGTRTPTRKLDRLYEIALAVDKFGIGTVLIILSVALSPMALDRWLITGGLPLLVIYAVLLVLSFREMRRSTKNGELQDPFYSSSRSASKLLHETVPNLILPGYLGLLATFYYPLNGILLLAFLTWRLVLGKAEWNWPLKALRNWYLK